MSTKTKIILRIAVTLVVLGLVVLGAWLIWFKPTNELEVFQNLTSLQDEAQSNFKTALNAEESGKQYGVKTRDYYIATRDEQGNIIHKEAYTLAGFSSQNANEKVYGQIAFYRAYMFGSFGAKDTANVNPYVSTTAYQNNFQKSGDNSVISKYNGCLGLEAVYNLIDEAFDYYYSYVQLAENVDKEAVKEMNRLISDLSADYNGFYALQSGELTSLYKAADTASNKATILHEVCAIYEKLYSKYLDIVESYNDLTLELKDFVTEYVFDGVVSYDKNTVVYEILLNSVKEFAMQVKAENLNNVAHYKVFTKNAEGIVVFNNNDKYIAYTADLASIVYAHKYSKVTDALVSTYAEISKNYAAALTGNKSILVFNNAVKNEFVTQYYSTSDFGSDDNKTYNNLQSTYNPEYLSGLQEILTTVFYLDANQKAQYNEGEVA